MATYILLHGAWHGAWAWKEIVPKLRTLGHVVYTPDLPGHGNNKVDFKHVNLTLYTQAIIDLIKKIDSKVILIGHSMAGIIISQVAEYIP